MGDEIVFQIYRLKTDLFCPKAFFENNTRDQVFGNITKKYDFTDWLFLKPGWNRILYAGC
jgi:hypothetical protein